MRVLVVDSRAPARRRFARVLAGAGHEVIEAAGPGPALERCRERAPDVALLDARSCDGLLASIKRDPVAFRTAVVLVRDAGIEVDAALDELRRGVQDYLVEPDDGEVIARVEAAARTKELQQELVAQGLRLEALLREDALTGLANRRAILTQLGGMVSGARRHGHPLSIAIVDLDEFKRINDAHGHHTGDEVLVATVRAMRAHLRAEDQLGRLGGEEFLVLLPDTDAGAARHVAEKLREAVADAPARVPVTASIGIAGWAAETPENLLRRADAALYAAKDAGRDRVVTATLHGRT
jgi:two-component system cell cycle response regulator